MYIGGEDLTSLGNKEVFSRNLQKYIELSGKERSEIVEEIGFNYSTFTDWVNGNTYPRIDRIEKLANYFGISKSDLIEEKPTDTTGAFRSIPFVGQIAAGQPVLAEENIEDYFNLDSRIKSDFCLKIKGDSMMGAGIFPGDIVFIRKQDNLENGEIGAILLEDEATLKKFYKEDDTVILQSENDFYKPMIFTNGNIKILGKLVAVLNIRE